jgi:hypothetical protein
MRKIFRKKNENEIKVNQLRQGDYIEIRDDDGHLEWKIYKNNEGIIEVSLVGEKRKKDPFYEKRKEHFYR